MQTNWNNSSTYTIAILLTLTTLSHSSVHGKSYSSSWMHNYSYLASRSWLLIRLNLLWTADINECEVNNGGCEEVCVNTLGSFQCKCREGQTLESNKRNCSSEFTLYCLSLVPGPSRGLGARLVLSWSTCTHCSSFV